jgi:hypothetical protein
LQLILSFQNDIHMKNDLYAFILPMILLTGCFNCVEPAGIIKDEERTITEFSTVELDGAMDVVIKERLVSEKNRVVVRADQNVLPHVKTVLQGSRLKLSLDKCVKGNNPVEIHVYVNEISKIENDGSGTIRSENMLRSDRFDIEQNGSGTITLQLRANRVVLDNDGSGIIRLAGNANTIEVDHDGSGVSELFDFQSKEAKVDLGGSGIVNVYATEKMKLSLNGSGSIRYKGTPQELKTDKNGSGEIHEAK